eukprot:1984239-Prymnesium_polylepis.2
MAMQQARRVDRVHEGVDRGVERESPLRYLRARRPGVAHEDARRAPASGDSLGALAARRERPHQAAAGSHEPLSVEALEREAAARDSVSLSHGTR